MGRRVLFMVGVCLVAAACGGATDPASPVGGSSPSPTPSEGGREEIIFTQNLFTLPSADHFRRLADAADAVLVGTVVHINARFEMGPAGAPLIYSYVTVRVEESLKGNPSPVILIRNVGGQVGEKRLTVSHVPTFRHVGEKALLFLQREGGYLTPHSGLVSKILVHGEATLSFLDGEISLPEIRQLVGEEG